MTLAYNRVATILEPNPQAVKDLEYYLSERFSRGYMRLRMQERHNIVMHWHDFEVYMKKKYRTLPYGGKSLMCFLIDETNVYRQMLVDMATNQETVAAIHRALKTQGLRCSEMVIKKAIYQLGIKRQKKTPQKKHGHYPVCLDCPYRAANAP